MSQIKAKKLEYLQENEPPTKKLISEADVLISNLVKKQQKTTTTLQEQLSIHQDFTKSSESSAINNISGTSSLKCFQHLVDQQNEIDRLKAAGLNDADIDLHLHQLGQKIEPNVRKEKIEIIQEILKNQETSPQSHSPKSQNLPESLTIKPDSTETKLLKFALSNHKQQLALPHPIDHINEIEKNTFNDLNEPRQCANKIRRKARKLRKRLERRTDLQRPTPVHNSTQSMAKTSLWDVETREEIAPKTIKNYTCKPQTLYTIKNGQIVKLNDRDCLQNEKRLTIEEIRKLPKYATYATGVPSPVLYVKNLSKGVTKDDLEGLFKHFHSEIEEIKIMSGKMRGQSFITFNSSANAQQALEAINGTVLRNKPVIIQYSNRK